MRVQTPKQCSECEGWFLASRPAWLCSARCRQRSRRKLVEQLVAEALANRGETVTK